jgi:hypothetical protein
MISLIIFGDEYKICKHLLLSSLCTGFVTINGLSWNVVLISHIRLTLLNLL